MEQVTCGCIASAFILPSRRAHPLGWYSGLQEDVSKSESPVPAHVTLG